MKLSTATNVESACGHEVSTAAYAVIDEWLVRATPLPIKWKARKYVWDANGI